MEHGADPGNAEIMQVENCGFWRMARLAAGCTRWSTRSKPTACALSARERRAEGGGSIQRGIAADPDNPELTDAQMAEMRPAAEVMPAPLYAELIKRQDGHGGIGLRRCWGAVPNIPPKRAAR